MLKLVTTTQREAINDAARALGAHVTSYTAPENKDTIIVAFKHPKIGRGVIEISGYEMLTEADNYRRLHALTQLKITELVK
jgi:hypothetical protein